GIIAILLYSFLKKEQEEHESEQERLFASYEKILRKADTKALGMLDKAQETSANILGETRNTNEHIAESLDRVLQLVAQKHITSLNLAASQFQKISEESLKELKTKLAEQSHQTAQLTQAQITAALESFTQTLLNQSSGGKEAIDKKTQVLLD